MTARSALRARRSRAGARLPSCGPSDSLSTMTYVQMNAGDPAQAQEGLNKAKKISEGKGFVGWLTKLFMGKNFTDQMQRGVNTAQQAIDNSQMQQQLMQYGTPAT